MHVDEETIDLVNQALNKVINNVTLPMALRVIISILRRMYPQKSFDWLYELIYFETNPSMSFQKSEISHAIFSLDKNNEYVRVEVELNFLSIFGASSPLPQHYSEAILENSFDNRVLADFLSMYNHRLKRLIYPIWRQQRYYIQYENNLNDNFSSYLLAFMGLYNEPFLKDTSLDLHKLLPFAGILSMKQKSTVSLLNTLRHYFSHRDITIEEAIVSKSILPKSQYVKLGQENNLLGHNMSIGTFVMTRNLKFRIHFNNISWEMLKDFGTQGSKRGKLREFIDYIQTDPLDYDVRLHIKKEEIKPCMLDGSGDINLGTNAWLGQINDDKTIAISDIS